MKKLAAYISSHGYSAFLCWCNIYRVSLILRPRSSSSFLFVFSTKMFHYSECLGQACESKVLLKEQHRQAYVRIHGCFRFFASSARMVEDATKSCACDATESVAHQAQTRVAHNKGHVLTHVVHHNGHTHTHHTWLVHTECGALPRAHTKGRFTHNVPTEVAT